MLGRTKAQRHMMQMNMGMVMPMSMMRAGKCADKLPVSVFC